MIRLEDRVNNGDLRAAEREAKRAELRALERAQDGVESFEEFVARVRPSYMPVPDHLKPIYNLVNRSRFEQVRALISMPPRHGKTETLRLALAYRCLYDPACQNAYASYGVDLSEETGRIVRGLARQVGVQVGRIANDAAKSGTAKVLDWKTQYGGGLKSTSVGGAITGRGVEGLLLIDDPIKGQEAAYSLAERTRVWRWLRMDVLSRLEGGGSCIIVQTRWHEDDPIGRMLAGGPDWVPGLGEDWLHVNLPAIHDGQGDPIDERLAPERAVPLWPSVNARWPDNVKEAMHWYKICRARGEYEWWALYQGVPRSENRKVFGGNPGSFALPFSFIGKRGIITLDPAATAKTSSDYSALGAFFMQGYGDRTTMRTVQPRFGDPYEEEILNPDPTRLFVYELWKGREAIPEVVRRAKRWQTKYGLPVGVETVAGFALVKDIIDLTVPGMKLIEITCGGKDKYTRSIPTSKAWRDDRVDVITQQAADLVWENDISNETNRLDFIRVMNAFTGLGDQEDDLVDITTHAYNRMYKHRPFGRGIARTSSY